MREGITTGHESLTVPERLDGRGQAGDGSPLVPGTVLAGRYEVRGVLGRGGMGVVVTAYDRTLREEVAVKLLRLELAGERRWAERLAREVKMARQIHHPNVCQVFDFVQTDGHVFIVMELALRTLRDELGADIWRERSEDGRLVDARAVTAALGAIHQAGIVHRDVTAQNVLRMADGRLVLSDFGLAMDADETTASVQGGTVPYMAPEVALGGRASPASDIWALGIVIHEIVLGRRPSWRGNSVDRGMERPAGKLSAGQAHVVDICRACTTARASARPADAAAILIRLDAAGGPRRRRWRRPANVAMGALALALSGWASVRSDRRPPRASEGSPAAVAVDNAIEITGTPEDWTISSRVLTKVAERVHCLTALPDQRTIRYVFGVPKKVEDVDIVTGDRRTPPLVPAAYAEGCPELSPDGKELIFQGYDSDGRAGILRSTNADGSNAAFVVPAADSSVLSEPKWFAGGKAFVYDADRLHFGVVDRGSGRPTILPESGDRSLGLFRFVCGRSVYGLHSNSEPDGHGLDEMPWPTFGKRKRLAIRGATVSWSSSDCRLFYSTDVSSGAIVEIDSVRFTARRLGFVKNRPAWLTEEAGSNLIFSTVSTSSDVWKYDGTGHLRRVTRDGTVIAFSTCGRDNILVARLNPRGRPEIDRVALDGSVHFLQDGDAPLCSRVGPDWWYTSYSQHETATEWCGDAGCHTIMRGPQIATSLSPDESRIAYISYSGSAARVGWLPSHGGRLHDIAETETGCGPGWSSNTTVWVSRRTGGRLIWTEVNVDSGVETGRITPGAKDCADAGPDPLSPVEREYRLVYERETEIRVKARPW